MTDLTFCYLHMTRHDLQILDTLETPDYIKGELSEDELDIPPHMVPPNPDDSDTVLPSQVHPSYPYGNPTHMKHPAALPRPPYDPSSRALFEDMGYAGGGINGTLRWRDLALDVLVPVDEAKEEAKKATQARKMASGTTSNQNPQAAHPQQAPEGAGGDEGEFDENDENDDDDEGEEESTEEDEES